MTIPPLTPIRNQSVRVQFVKFILLTDDDYNVDARYGKVVKNQACTRIIITYIEKFSK